MRRSIKSFINLFRENSADLLLLFAFCVLIVFGLAETSASDLTGARVLEIEGAVESRISDQKGRVLRPGDVVTTGEELNIPAEGWIFLVLPDSTVRKFNGPTTVTIKEELPETSEGILARLGSAVFGMLFSREQKRSEVLMTTRIPEDLKERKNYLPLLVNPAAGSNLLDRPTKLEWRKVEGIPLYRVSLFSTDRLLWQGTTSDSYIDCPPEHCNFTPGDEYYWVVEGLIGNSALKSKAAEFKILPEVTRSELYKALKESDTSCPDPELSALIKVRLCLNLNIYDKALELIHSHWTEESLDRRAYLLRAEIKEKMGLFEEAFFDYQIASSMPASR